jgi:hypothetical protein
MLALVSDQLNPGSDWGKKYLQYQRLGDLQNFNFLHLAFLDTKKYVQLKNLAFLNFRFP